MDDDLRRMRDKLKALSKRHSLEIIDGLYGGKKNLTEISSERKIPYTTVQQRAVELEKAGLVEIRDGIDEVSGRPVREVCLVNFYIVVSPFVINQIVSGLGPAPK